MFGRKNATRSPSSTPRAISPRRTVHRGAQLAVGRRPALEDDGRLVGELARGALQVLRDVHGPISPCAFCATCATGEALVRCLLVCRRRMPLPLLYAAFPVTTSPELRNRPDEAAAQDYLVGTVPYASPCSTAKRVAAARVA